MKKTVSVLVLLTLALVVSFYAISWYGARQTLQRLKTEVAEVGVLSWQGIRPGLDGTVRVEGLELILFALNHPLQAESATFDAGSPRALLQWLLDEQEGWPDRARLSLHELHLLITPTLAKEWLRAAPTQGAQWPRPWHLRACGDRGTPGGTNLLAMGIDSLNLDFILDWRDADTVAGTGVEGSGKKVVPELQGELHMGRLGSIDFRIRSGALPRSFAELADSEGRTVALAESVDWQILEIVIRDGGFMRRVAAYCTKGRYPSPRAWAQAATGELQQALMGWGINMGSSLADAYTLWLYEGGELSLRLASHEVVEPLSVQRWAEYLAGDDLVMIYNDRRLGTSGFTLDIDTFAARARPATPGVRADPAGTVMNPALLGRNSAGEPHAGKLGWRLTPVTSAERWLGRSVRVTLVSGQWVEGRLAEVTEDHLTVTRQLKGGEFGAPTDRKEIGSFAVWREEGEIPVIPNNPAILQ